MEERQQCQLEVASLVCDGNSGKEEVVCKLRLLGKVVWPPTRRDEELTFYR